MSRTIPLSVRFDMYSVRVPWTGCWIWTGAINGGGYGSMCYRGRRDGAHRFSWEYHNGQSIPEGMRVLHKCDMPSCVNPEHLFLGTQSDNQIDAQTKGRRYKQPADACLHGHPATPENVYFSGGHRFCLPCKRESRKRVKARSL